MAIKVNNTTVINDSRQLQNVASLDSTTISTINSNITTGFTAQADTGPSSSTTYSTTTVAGYHTGVEGSTMSSAPPSNLIVKEAQYSATDPVIAAISGSFYVTGQYYGGYYGGFLSLWVQTGSSLWTMKQNLYWDSITSANSSGTYYIDIGVMYLPAGAKVYLLAGNTNYGKWNFATNSVTINGYYQTAS